MMPFQKPNASSNFDSIQVNWKMKKGGCKSSVTLTSGIKFFHELLQQFQIQFAQRNSNSVRWTHINCRPIVIRLLLLIRCQYTDKTKNTLGVEVLGILNDK
jgi:hypothetical protein